ncbi:MAG TPA: alpha/beta hydrolase [Burkholderiaceae bacterium]|nr:alpha/beta hydrolase [Burkholderiaceae bacterium]
MHWTEWGDARNPRVLICVHGVSRVSRDFDTLARELSRHYRVICPDIVGRGRSDWLTDPLHYNVPQYVQDCAMLIAHLKADTVHWVGTSMGGLIGMGLAASQPDAIQRLVLNDVGPVIKGAALTRIGDYLGADISFKTFEEGAAYIKMLSAPFGEHSDAQWRSLSEHMLVQREETGARVWRLHYDPRIGDNFKLVARVTPSGTDMYLWNVYDAIKCPTLAIRGALSDLLSRETHTEMALRGPKATLAEIPRVGHAPTLMQPDQIAVVRDFLLMSA